MGSYLESRHQYADVIHLDSNGLIVGEVTSRYPQTQAPTVVAESLDRLDFMVDIQVSEVDPSCID